MFCWVAALLAAKHKTGARRRCAAPPLGGCTCTTVGWTPPIDASLGLRPSLLSSLTPDQGGRVARRAGASPPTKVLPHSLRCASVGNAAKLSRPPPPGCTWTGGFAPQPAHSLHYAPVDNGRVGSPYCALYLGYRALRPVARGAIDGYRQHCGHIQKYIVIGCFQSAGTDCVCHLKAAISSA